MQTMVAFLARAGRSCLSAVMLILAFLSVATGARAEFATQGEGLYKKEIFWLSWAAHGVNIPGNTTRVHNFQLGGEPVVMTCSLTNLTGNTAISGYRPGAYWADGLPHLYRIGATPGANSLVIGIVTTTHGRQANFRVSCSATLSGQPFELPGLVIADAETSSQGGSEFAGVTAPAGAQLRILETRRGPSCNTTYGYRTVGSQYQFHAMSGGDCSDGHPTFVGYVDGASSVDFAVKGGGAQAIAVGVMMANTDFGDAPHSYGIAYHVIDRVTNGGQPPLSPDPVSTPLFGAGAFTARATVAPAVRFLGSGVSFDGQAFANATGAVADSFDDGLTVGTPPETGAAGSTYSLTASCRPSGSIVSAWLDLNRNGTFEQNASEERRATCLDGFATPQWIIPNVTAAMAGTTYLRLRISDQDEGPSGVSFSGGEVEDYAVQLVQNDNDMRPVFSGLPTEIVPGTTYTGLQLTCTNAGPGTATEARCVPEVNVGAISGLSCTPAPPATVAAGASIICGFSYALAPGGVEPQVVFTGKTRAIDDSNGGNGDGGNNTSTMTRPVQKPRIVLQKVLDGTPGRDLDTDQFRLRIAGTGGPVQADTTGTGTTTGGVSAELRVTAGSAYTLSELALGTTNLTNYDASYVCTNVGNGGTADSSGTGASLGLTLRNGDDVTCVFTNSYAPEADLVTVKSVVGPTEYLDGETVEFSIRVTNNGPATARNITLTDLLPAGLTAASGNGAVTLGTYNAATGLWTMPQLGIGSSATLTLRGTVDPGIGGATITNVTTVAISDIPDPTAVGDVPEAAVTVTQNPQVRLVKSALLNDGNGNGYADAGETVTYTFVVHNTGNVTLTGVALTDPLFDPQLLTTIASLAPGGTAEHTATYTLTPADLDAGRVTNTATASGTPPVGPPVTDTSGSGIDNNTPTVTLLPSRPEIRLVKTATLIDGNGNGLPDVGELLRYSFVIQNTGNVTLSGITLTDPALAASPLSIAGSLAAGASLTVADASTERALTQADIDAGSTTNSALVRGTPPTGSPVTDRSGTAITNDTPTVTPLVRQPGMTLAKTGALLDGNSDGIAQPGEIIRYSFAVTNTGNVTLSNLRIEDPKFSPLLVGVIPSLLPGASGTVSADYLLTQADINAGAVDNTATLRATAPGGTPVTPVTDSETVTVPQAPALSLVKQPLSPASVDAVGQVVTWRLVATNSGNVTLNGPLSVTDPQAETTTCPTLAAGGLAPGASVTCQATQRVTQADLDAGQISNLASITAQTPGGSPVTSPDAGANVPAILNPALSLDKVALWRSGDAFIPGAVLSYEYRVTNTGNVTLTGTPAVADNMIPTTVCPALPAGGLVPGDTLVCTGSYTVTTSDVALGSVTNNATVTIGTTTSPPDTVVLPPDANPALTLVKELVSGNDFTDVGDELIWRFTVTNTGNVSFVRDVVIEDDLLGGPLVCFDSVGGTRPFDPFSLVPSRGRVSCDASYLVTQADLDRGHVINHAHAASVYAPQSSNPVAVQSPSDDARADGVATGALTVVKTATPASGGQLGETVSYRIEVTNSGNVTLSNVRVNDPLVPALSCTPAAPAVLAPGAAQVCLGSYVLTQTDVDNGAVVNTATARGLTPTGTEVSNRDTATHTTLPGTPALDLVKTGSFVDVDGNGLASPGDQIVYTFVLRNSGSLTLTGAGVRDDRLTPPVVASGLTLAPGASRSFVRIKVLTQADIDAGPTYVNQAQASGTPPSGPPISDPSGPTPGTDGPTEVLLPLGPAIGVEKSVGSYIDSNGNGRVDAGDHLDYRIEVRNTGNVTLTNVVVTDPLLGGNIVTIPSLAPGQLRVLTPATHPVLRYQIQLANVDAGQVTNTASATGTPVTGGPPVSGDGSVTEPLTPNPGIALVKTGTVEDTDANGRANPGDVIRYSFTVTNTGSVTLTDITVTDSVLTPALVGTVASLAPGASATLNGAYVLTQPDIDAGQLTNTATAAGSPPSGPPVSDISGSSTGNDQPTVTPIPPAPAIRLVKSGVFADENANGRADPAETIRYTFVIHNTGNVTLTWLQISDPLLPSSPISVPGSLAPGGQITVESAATTYALTLTDIDAGQVRNTAIVRGSPPSGPPVTDTSGTTQGDDAPTVVPLPQAPALTLAKSGARLPPGVATPPAAGDSIRYSFVVTNTGNVTLTAVEVNDPLFTPSLIRIIPQLVPGAAVTVEADYVITQADIDAGARPNLATVTGTAPGGGSTPPVTSDTTVPLTQQPLLALEKTLVSPVSVSAVGQVITFDLAVRNAGNMTLAGPVTISDPTADTATCPALPAGGLAPGATLLCAATHAVTQGDLDAGVVSNTATAQAEGPSGPVVSPPATETVPVIARPALTIEKSTSWVEANGFASGVVIPYSYLVTNSGNVTLNGTLTVSDNRIAPGGVSCPALPGGGLVPGGTLVCTASYMMTGGDMALGSVTNNATATIGTVTSPPDSVTVPPTMYPAITLVKELASGNGYSAVDEELEWRFIVVNTGLVELDQDIVIHDPLLSAPLVCRSASSPGLRPHALSPESSTAICTATYTVTQDDLDRGHVLNRAYAATDFAPGTPHHIPVQSPYDDARADARTVGRLELVKTADPTAGARLGDLIDYRIVVRNTGNITLQDVRVSDPMLAGLSCDIAAPVTLAPAAPGNVLTCTGTYRVLQSDIDAGSIVNTASVRGLTPDGTPVVTTGTATHLPQAGAPELDLVKTGVYVDENLDGRASPGDRIVFEFSLRNAGNVTLTGVELRDDGLTPPVIASGVQLAPGETRVYSRSITLTQPLIDAGSPHENNATATGTPPSGPPVMDPSGPRPETDGPTLVPLPIMPQMVLTKVVAAVTDSNASGRTDAGDHIEYRIELRNTGNVTLRNVTIDDVMLGGQLHTQPVMEPGAVVTLTAATHPQLRMELTQAHIDAGTLSNTALAGADAATGGRVQASDTAVEIFGATPQISLVKTATFVDGNANAVAEVGEVIRYGFRVENHGTVTLRNIEVTDPMLSATAVGTIASLAPGQAVDLPSHDYALTPADIRAGRVENSALATGRPPSGPPVQDHSGTTSSNDTPTLTPLNRPPVAQNDVSEGNTTGAPVTVQVLGNDSDPDGPLEPASVVLTGAPGDGRLLDVPGEGTWQVDPVSGDITFLPEPGFTANPTPITYRVSDLQGAESEPATVTITFVARPPVAANDSSTDNETGQPVRVEVLTNDSDPDGRLDPASVQIVGAAGDGRSLVVDGEGTWTVDPGTGAITFTPQGGFTSDPTPILYSVADNDGNRSNTASVTLTFTARPPVALDDTSTGNPLGDPVVVSVLGNDSDPDGQIDPTSVRIVGAPGFGQSLVVTGEGRWDVDPVSGSITFTPEAQFYGDPTPIRYTVADNDGNRSNEASVAIEFAPVPELRLVIDVDRVEDSNGDGVTGAGDTVYYRFTVSNPGRIPLNNVDLSNVTLPLPGLSCLPVTLQPGQSAVLVCTGNGHVITPAEAAAGTVAMTATASGVDLRGTPVDATADVSFVIAADEGIAVEKRALLGNVRVGQLVPYVITLTNRSTTLQVTTDLRDQLPDGFVYRKGTARIGALVQDPEISGSRLMFRDIVLPPGASVSVEMQVFVSGSVQPGPQVNRAQSFNPVTGRPNSREATATVMVEADPVFDCGTVIGTVFDDYNLDSYQNPGEPGIPGVRLVTVRGTIITTDRFGRYSVPCADLPRDIGSNFVLKLDDRTLPSGYRITTENPGDVRLTPGKMSELNFGASLGRLVRLELNAAAFTVEDGKEVLRRELRDQLRAVAEKIRRTPSVMRVIYVVDGESNRQVKGRLALVERELRRVWRGTGRYGLILELMVQDSKMEGRGND